MKIAIASGKGGTGKTTVAVNLALSLKDVQLLDCDVEEPNCNLFLGLELEKLEEVTCQVPKIDPEKCTLCRKCANFCRYNALAALPSKVLFIPALCHGCGGCGLICPEEAIREKARPIGFLEKAKPGLTPEFYHGVLNIGEAMATPLIRALLRHIDSRRPAILDSPPGAACPVLATIGAADYCVLVTESTPFGFHDFGLALKAVTALNIPFGVVLNRDGLGDSRVEDFCRLKKIPILLRIPNDRRIAQLYSEGIPFVKEMPEWKEKFTGMFAAIKALAKNQKPPLEEKV
jgi:MinD superfamily P-loop ATPase